MKKRIILAVLVMMSLVGASMALHPGAALAATPKDEICAGISAANDNSCGDGSQLTNVIRNIINIFSIIVGIVAVIMIMVSGFKFITAGGDSGNVTSAKHTLVYAIVGLIVVALSQFIVKFVLDKLK